MAWISNYMYPTCDVITHPRPNFNSSYNAVGVRTRMRNFIISSLKNELTWLLFHAQISINIRQLIWSLPRPKSDIMTVLGLITEDTIACVSYIPSLALVLAQLRSCKARWHVYFSHITCFGGNETAIYTYPCDFIPFHIWRFLQMK